MYLPNKINRHHCNFHIFGTTEHCDILNMADVEQSVQTMVMLSNN